MKKSILTVSLIFEVLVGLCQLNCLPVFNGVAAGDEPPGCVLCNSSYEGSTEGYTSDFNNFEFTCGEIDNSQWFTVIAGKEGWFEISTKVQNCRNERGIEIAVYDEQFNLMSDCIIVPDQSQPLVLTVLDLTPNQNYHIMVDGRGGDICDFEFEVSGRQMFDADYLYKPIKAVRTGGLCLESTACYSIEPIDGAIGYLWKIPPMTRLFSGGEIGDLHVCITFRDYGKGDIEVTPYNRCQIGASKTRMVELKVKNESNFLRLCPFDFANHQFMDTCYLTDLGCDSCISYTVNEIQSQVFSIDTVICEEECVQIGDSCFSAPGSYFVNFEEAIAGGCDSLVQINLVTENILSSPFISYESNPDGILVEWAELSGAEFYEIFIDRDSFATVEKTYFLIENISFNSTISVKVQPIGSCTYLPAEIICTNQFSKISNNFLSKKITVFPNPTTGNIFIDTDLKIEEVAIYDLAGRFLQKEKTTSFDLKNGGAGVFFLKIKTKEGVAVKRVLVN